MAGDPNLPDADTPSRDASELSHAQPPRVATGRRAKTASALALAVVGVGVVAVVWVTRPPGTANSAPPAATATTADPALNEEALIARAQAALARGDAARAQAALREHAARFPNGTLTTQRKLLEAYAERVAKGSE